MSVTTRERIKQMSARLGELYQQRGDLRNALKLARDHDDQTPRRSPRKAQEIQHEIDTAQGLSLALSKQESGRSSYGGLGETIFTDPTAITARRARRDLRADREHADRSRVRTVEEFAARLGPRSQDGGGDLIVPDAARAQVYGRTVRRLYQLLDCSA